jgi:fatty acid desaturase
MATPETDRKINWYRSPIDRETMAKLNQRSDWQGFLQTAGHLGLLTLTGVGAWFASTRLPVIVLLLILYLHGTFWAFLMNAFHEFCHKTVFKTKALNTFFLYLVSFLSWNNPVLFWASHQEHHKYTLHPPEDQEVLLPAKLTLVGFLKIAIISPWDIYPRVKGLIRLCLGKIDGEWPNYLFPASAVEMRRKLFTFARLTLLGHILIVAVSLYFGQWIIPVIITLAPFYGGGLQYICNNTQHTGLQDKTSDYRLCTRTIRLDPFTRFLYWQMNYHVEHHMFAAVPCYNLAKLHKVISPDLPATLNLLDAWKLIIEIQKKQAADASYYHVPQLPGKPA